jgi:penicillin-binding protein 1C
MPLFSKSGRAIFSRIRETAVDLIRWSGLRRWVIASAFLFVGFGVWFILCLPSRLFDVPYSTVLLDKEGNLLSGSIASDGQWRFPQTETVPDKFREAIIHYEDRRFDSHPGLDPLAMLRATKDNLSAGKVVSGGSTITMQVVRLARGAKERSVWNKLAEVILACRLEMSYSKDEILLLYASHAPFGGNVVGIDAACWRYFGRQPDELSWGEAALLAVLPNNPSLIHLSRNRDKLRAKRDRLLADLAVSGKIDQMSYGLALAEELPSSPHPLPRFAPHLLTHALKDAHRGERIESTLDLALQRQVSAIAQDHHRRLAGNHVFNAAAIVVEVKSGNVLAYVGNVDAGKEMHEDVDLITSPRSTGSILKPFLFAALLDEGAMLQHTLVPDVPTVINGFAPKNFSRDYDGAVPADKALIRSLNVPAVVELRDYRYEKFHDLLKASGITTLTRPPDHYGLSLILGGAEGTLWDITGAYASMARTLNNYFVLPGKAGYKSGTFHSPSYLSGQQATRAGDSPFGAAAIYLTFEALKDLYRPGEETGWRNFYSSKKVAWKTGTSFGFRDGWSVGVNGDYAVGVWVGNADGEGRPGLTGTEAAAPMMFDIFSMLPGRTWFDPPRGEMTEVSVCTASGQRTSEICPEARQILIATRGLDSKSCSFHQKVHLTADRKYRTHGLCESVDDIVTEPWFVLPPAQEHFYRTLHLGYRSLPPYRADCADPSQIVAMDMIYPRTESRIFVPKELDGSTGRTVFQVVHRDPKATIYWHIDGQYIGSTTRSHKLPLAPEEGNHEITLVDEQGEILERSFQVVSH